MFETFGLNEPTNQNSEKSPKLLSLQIRKRCYNTLGTSVINSPMSPPALANAYVLAIVSFCENKTLCGHDDMRKWMHT